jgi:16S rRNA (guanine(966)-N(2))-methyltransferase RsmD
MRVIAGKARGRRISAPRGLATRPTSARARESIFSRLEVRMQLEGARVLDVFAGSGSLGIESLSRGASHATFVDSSRAAAAAIAKNLRTLGAEARARVVIADARRALGELASAGEQYDLVFVDAPYKNDLSAEIVGLLAARGLVRAGGWVVVGQSRRAEGPPEPEPPLGLENVARIGDHRIAFYRRPEGGPAGN